MFVASTDTTGLTLCMSLMDKGIRQQTVEIIWKEVQRKKKPQKPSAI